MDDTFDESEFEKKKPEFLSSLDRKTVPTLMPTITKFKKLKNKHKILQEKENPIADEWVFSQPKSVTGYMLTLKKY